MGKLNDAYINACVKNSDGRYCYVGESNATPTSCSDFTKQNMYEAGVITKEERYDHNSFWAGEGNAGILNDPKRFKRHSRSETPKDGWLQWYNGYHISTFYKNGCFEACPRARHYLASNGKTAVGWFAQNHNCSGGSLTCYYEILDKEGYEKTTIDKIIARAEEIANDNSMGYNNKVGYNLGADFGQLEYDCGGFVSDCLRHASVLGTGIVFEPNLPTGTWGYDVILTSAGFKKLSFDYNGVKRGDILIRDGHHTEIAYGDNKSIGSHFNFDGKVGDSQDNEISIVPLATNWDYMYRLDVTETTHTVLQYGSYGSEVKELQEILNKKNNAGLAVDGSFGNLTRQAVMAFQKACGIVIDGIVGIETWTKLEEEEPHTELTPTKRIEEALEILKGTYGSNPARKEKLTAKYGATEAQKIQDIVTLAYK